MAIWLELRCDLNSPGCYSAQNNGPMVLSTNVRATVVLNLVSLETQAIAEGWVRIRGGFVCPNCKLNLPTKE